MSNVKSQKWEGMGGVSMPVDWFTPLGFALAMIVLPLYGAWRGTSGAFMGICGICLVATIGVIVLCLREAPLFQGVVMLLWAVPTMVGLLILGTRSHR
jgi:hypothetical protein